MLCVWDQIIFEAKGCSLLNILVLLGLVPWNYVLQLLVKLLNFLNIALLDGVSGNTGKHLQVVLQLKLQIGWLIMASNSDVGRSKN